ncbi:protein RIK isoform X3 [Glycine soja]|uniref:Protein RIK n=2 Tax=Glycine subgen. Soja TaxID=1462606 RepID=A0A0R0IX52_SOYBN|nr:protein RIK isoform X6 [Glycine max]XP_028244990.1 protein RIK isoform X3 [Glycine soja]RZB98632.1 Protein RIK isoform B [Glycine soja]|eukprot:XP_006585774.1 protein RIK isoform X4 [Glycine max]
MTEDSSVRVSSSDKTSAANDASQTRQRKKRKWDQPAESLMPVGMAVPGALPLSNAVSLGGVAFPAMAPMISGALLRNPLAASSQLPQHTVAAAVAAQKLNQQKIQDELIIAREIVINDAESSVRYKLTKRQTQEEIQRCTGAIVITRGKYRLPNAPHDGGKPLYLHISAGAHIKETAERILAVDRAAAMIEEMLKQEQNSQSISSASPSALVNILKMLSTCVFLGFDADPSLNIVARIRGPNDQYINHIMNETGATVVLRGRGSGNNECLNGEDGQQPLHLFLSSNNAKSLEDAKLLAENLLDTICTECGALRVSSCKVYSAVPPPQQVYTAVPPPQQVYSGPSLLKQIPTAISPPQQVYSAVPPPQQLLTGVQSSGIDLEADAPTTSASNGESRPTSSSDLEKEKRPPQRRKFQELPVGSKGTTKLNQGLQPLKPYEQSDGLVVRNILTMPAPKKLVPPSSNGMPPPLLRTMPPPPPPKFSDPFEVKVHNKNKTLLKTKSDAVPDTLVNLMEYGEEDDDDIDDSSEESLPHDTRATGVQKPFWAL